MKLEPRGIEQNSKNLRVSDRGPACRYKKASKHQNASDEASKKVERHGTHNGGEEEQAPLRAPNGQWFVQPPVNRMKVRVGHSFPLQIVPLWEKPAQKIDGADCHTDAKH